jgi:hypothetical protein
LENLIREYVSRDLLRQFSGELAELYRKIGCGEIKNLEDHLAKLSYKIAVELAQLNLLMASALELPYIDTRKLRGKAVQLVNQSKGYVPLKDVILNQIDLRNLEENE